MKYLLIFLLGVFCAVNTNAENFTQSIFPENDLWKEDRFEQNSNIDQELFNRIIELGKKHYDPLAKENNESLKINANWSNSTVNANCSRRWGSVIINMYGGLARREEISPEGFMLVLCHELAHAYGGKPYIRPSSRLAAEGQADYYGAQVCAKKILTELVLDDYVIEPTYFMEQTCMDSYVGGEKEVCVRTLTAGQSLGRLMAVLMKKDEPDYETPDRKVVKKTVLSYPETIQCRLDTYLNGATNGPRPACWFKK